MVAQGSSWGRVPSVTSSHTPPLMTPTGSDRLPRHPFCSEQRVSKSFRWHARGSFRGSLVALEAETTATDIHTWKTQIMIMISKIRNNIFFIRSPTI